MQYCYPAVSPETTYVIVGIVIKIDHYYVFIFFI